MRGVGIIKHFLSLWLNKLTNLVKSKFTLPVASSQLHNISTKNEYTNKHVAKIDSGATQHFLKIGVGQLCDNNSTILFNKFECFISHNNQQILRGIRNRIDGLWYIPLIIDTIPIQTETKLLEIILLMKT